MQTTLETLGQLERRLNVAVPIETIDSEVHKRLEHLAKTMKIPGFRPGKVPIKMVAQQYGPQVRSDVISEAVQQSVNDAIRTQNLRVAGYPRIEAKEGSPDDRLEFSALFEVYPEIKLGEMSQITIVRPTAHVTPADVDRTIEILRKQGVRYETIEGGARPGDRALVSFTGSINGVEFPGGQAKDFPIVLGEGRMLPEFETALEAMKAGESKDFSLTFPADYHGKEVAGKTAHFNLTLQSVSEPKLPVVDADFARRFGIASGSIDELRAEITANLTLELKRKIEAKVKDQVMQALKATSDLAVPKSLIELEAENLRARTINEMQGRGIKPEDTQLTVDLFRPRAEERVAYSLIVNEIMRANQLQAKPEQVLQLVKEAAQSYEQPEAVVRWHYDKPERLNEFEMQAVEHNVVEWVLARARIEEQPTTFVELMEPGAV